MQYRSKKLLALPLIAAIAISACGSDDEAATTTAAGSDTTAAAEGSLAGICPETVAIQLDWMPEAEHGFLYQLVGDGWTTDNDKAYVTGPLVAGGVDTGVDIQIRSGGPAQQFTPVSQIMYNDDSITLGYVYTDEAIQFSGDFPTVAIESGFEKNPQMIMWDPATYPDVKTIADLGKAGVTVRYFGGAAYMEYFTGTGILSPDQVDGSYSGDPSLFIADEGKAAQQGFGSAEPYMYETVLQDWGKPVAYQYINDAGWNNYAESIATKPENITGMADCFKALVPMIQQASVDYLNDPTHGNAVILDAVKNFGEAFGWTYDQGNADYGVATMKADGLIANGPDSTLGNFDLDRVNSLIEIAVPIYETLGSQLKAGITAEDIVTNEFSDPSIGL